MTAEEQTDVGMKSSAHLDPGNLGTFQELAPVDAFVFPRTAIALCLPVHVLLCAKVCNLRPLPSKIHDYKLAKT
jgi:hypothetical protein